MIDQIKELQPFRRFKLLFKRLMPTSLLGRSLLILIVPVLLAQGIATYIFFDRHWETMTRRLSQGVAGEISLLARQFEKDETGAVEPLLIEGLASQLDLLVSYEPDKKELPSVQSNIDLIESSMLRVVERSMKEGINRPLYVHPHEKDDWIEVSVLLKNDQGVLHVLVPDKRLMSSTAHIFLLWMVGSSLVLMGIAIVFMRNQIKPIRKLAYAADRFGRGLSIEPIKPTGAREVRQAAQAFDLMRGRLQRQMEQRTVMLAGVSHDLRTPLARMKLEIEMMEDEKTASSIRQDVTEMETMIDGYLAFARGEAEEDPVPTDLSALIEGVIDNLKRQGVSVRANLEKDILLSIRTGAFYRCIGNLLSNARKYGDNIWVKLFRLNKTIQIVVEDDGPGVPDEKKEDVFRPFYRLDESRNPATGGVGLGMAIVQDVVHTHGGTVLLEDSNRGGLRVVISLPV